MAQYYYRENGGRTSVMNGPYRSIEDAQLNATRAGIKPANINILRKDGPLMVRIGVGGDFGSMRLGALGG